jgi:signal peptidase II
MMPEVMLTFGRKLALVALLVSTVGCDRVTKHFASATLANTPPQSFLADMLRLQYSENTGGFLSLGADWPPAVRTAVFTVGTSLILLATIVGVMRTGLSGAGLVALCLVAAGGISNIADRIAHGSVVDFLNVGIGPLRTGIFNVADMALMAGTAILILTQMRSLRTPQHQPDTDVV